MHSIKKTFEQAKRGKYGILEKLQDSAARQRVGIGWLTVGHAAFFPDIGDGGRLAYPDAPHENISDTGR